MRTLNALVVKCACCAAALVSNIRQHSLTLIIERSQKHICQSICVDCSCQHAKMTSQFAILKQKSIRINLNHYIKSTQLKRN